MLATPASRLLVLATAAVLTNGSGTPVCVNLVSELRDDAGVVDTFDDAMLDEGGTTYPLPVMN